MGKSKINISVNFEENDLVNVLKANIKNENIVKLLYDVLSREDLAIRWLFKMQLGHKYPDVPKKSTEGYISVEKMNTWSGDRDKYINSEFNQHGFIKVTVDDFLGLDDYYPLIVLATPHTDETGKQWNNIFRINFEDFIPDSEFDVYDISI